MSGHENELASLLHPEAPLSDAPAAPDPDESWKKFIIVDMKNEAEPTTGTDPIQLNTSNDKEVYWNYVTKGVHVPRDKKPTLVIMYGPPGCGKSWVLHQFFKQKSREDPIGWDFNQFVHLDPDTLRVCSKEYRMSLSGAHAAKLVSVQREYGDKLVPANLSFALGEKVWTEEGYTVDGKHLALANSALRSQVRDAAGRPHVRGGVRATHLSSARLPLLMPHVASSLARSRSPSCARRCCGGIRWRR